MKVNRLEAHDRLIEVHKQKDHIGQAVEECIRNVPDEVKSSFYVYAHKRTIGLDEMAKYMLKSPGKVPTHRIVWMPRITKPEPTENSMLFLVKKGSDEVRILWMLPDACMWEQYGPDKMTHDPVIWESIQTFKSNPAELMKRMKEEPTPADEKRFAKIIKKAAVESKGKKFRQASLEAYLAGLNSPERST